MPITTKHIMEAYPLQWPLGYKRTPKHDIQRSRFKSTTGKARDFLKKEVERLRGSQLVISTNLPVKDNGDLYADFGRYKIDDAGVAIYFKYKGAIRSMCCDKFQQVWENLNALAKSIEAIRAIERNGVSDFLDRAFTGFKELPSEEKLSCWQVLGIPPTKDMGTIKKAYLQKVRFAHPDSGGSHESFIELQEAHKAATAYANN